MTENAVRHTVSVPVPAEPAFRLFTDGLASWWPAEYTWSRDVLETIAIEPREGGRCFERGPHGFQCDWGRVLAWEPPRRVVFTWQISPRREPEPDPAKAGEVEVRFEPGDDGGTRVALEHRGFARHGDDADAYREAMGSPQGWPYILDRYGASISGKYSER
jgi:uncharacterized protein YndB with AHSA1/START domain